MHQQPSELKRYFGEIHHRKLSLLALYFEQPGQQKKIWQCTFYANLGLKHNIFYIATLCLFVFNAVFMVWLHLGTKNTLLE